ncbi:MAG: ATP-binding cassette domain-containing protein [Myxococcales bacterium]|nr:ATP-binding cassette domain-containing protein [Myxococcales bacterium]
MTLAKPEWRRLGLGTLFLVVGSGASLAFPQGIRMVIDQALGGARAQSLDRAALLMAVIALVFGLSIACRYVLFTVAGERIVTNLRLRLYRSILDQEVGFFDARRTGELTSRLSSDTAVLQNAVSVNVSMALRSAAHAAGGIVLLLITSPLLTGIMLAVVPAVAMGAVVYGRRVRSLARDVQDALAGASEIAEESIAGLRTVRSFSAEPKEAARYSTAVERAFVFARRRIFAGGTFMAVASFAAYASAVLVFWYGGRLVASGGMTVGQLTSFLVYTLIVAFALGGLADLWADFMRAAGAAERVFDLMERQPAIPPHGGLVLPAVRGEVELRNVSFAYPTRPDVAVLSGLDLRLSPGEIVAVVGPSGAGKSTVAALMTRFYDPGAGDVLFDGHDVRSLDARWLRQRIGVVAQEPVLFSTSIAENIRYGRPEASTEDVQEAAHAANAHDFVLRFPQGYDTAVGERGVQLSGGQKQRIAIARALLKDPRLLILDEATSALDAESEHLVQEALERLMKGRTTLIIAHRLSTVMRADRVVVLDRGRVVQDGPHALLVKQDGIYRRLVERQFAGGPS